MTTTKRRVGVAAVLGCVLLTGGPVAAAHAGTDSEGWQIRQYHATYTLAEDASVRVEIDLLFDFDDVRGHGPYLTLPTVQGYDDQYDRIYPVSDVTASSPTGAPDRVHVDRKAGGLAIRIGEEDRDDVVGQQRYHIGYTIDGVVNPQQDHDEFFWNVVGTDWEIPLNDLTVVVQGPDEVVDLLCFAGPRGSGDPCGGASLDGGVATFTHDRLEPGEALTVVTAFPSGTFPHAMPLLVERRTIAKAFAVTPVTGPLALLVLVGGIGLAVHRVRQRGRDEQYLGLAPGTGPATGDEVRVGVRDTRAPVAVQFQPPEGFRPGEIGTLIDEKADPRDVTATIIDLAVRGYLRIEQVEEPNRFGRGGDWKLVRLRFPDEHLEPFEASLHIRLFAGRGEVLLSELRRTFASSMAEVQSELYKVVTDHGWFRGNPRHVRQRWVAAGLGIIVLGAALTLVLALTIGWGLVPAPLFLVGIVVLFLARSAPARTAAGTAVLAQALGFRRYLVTAEANQLRFEEGEDLFSRYLPYAIVFGVAERWASLFEQLAAQGRAVPEPDWYVGPYAGAFWLSGGAFGRSLEAFSTTATEAIAAPAPSTTGSSGGSGFGGGGFSGGGGGGGGGGGW